MKKTILVICAAAGFLAQSALATISFTATPTSQTASAGGTFNVTLQLTVTQSTNPNNLGGFDVIFEGATTQNATNISNDFSITGASSNITGWQPIGSTPDALTTAHSDHAGFVQNLTDQGFTEANTSQTQATPTLNLSLATYTFSIASGTPAGTYTFETTGSYTSTQGGATARFSDASDQSGNVFAANNPATFSITVVPEPATWSLLALGGLGAVGVNILRARRKA